VKFSFDWRIAYWIIFSAVLAAVVFSIFGVGITTFVFAQDPSSHIPARLHLA
jgi:hypothetical protein